nr:baseplate J/gp47 family protein [uncultured Holophaga sp.]
MSTPSFLTTTTSTILSEVVSSMESALGKTLYAAQLERILCQVMAYREVLLRLAIQAAAEQNLVDYATGTRLEALGDLVGVSSRKAAEPATVTWRVTLPETSTSDTTISSGWECTDTSGLLWLTTADVTIPAGSLNGDVAAQCEAAGTSGNGLVAGTSFSPLTSAATVVSLDESTGGTAEETDDALRARILAAPFGFSAAGPAKAYYYHALNADASVVDVGVMTGDPGEVLVYPLSQDGMPSAELIATIQEALDSETVRPLCDLVTVAAPTEVAYSIAASITLAATADQDEVMDAVQTAADAYVQDRASALGKDLIGSQIIAKLGSVDGVYKVELSGWTDQVLARSQWANGSVTLTVAGIADE